MNFSRFKSWHVAADLFISGALSKCTVLFLLGLQSHFVVLVTQQSPTMWHKVLLIKTWSLLKSVDHFVTVHY